MDEDALNFKGPGNVISAAMIAFYLKPRAEKLKAILKFRELEAKAEFVITEGIDITEATKLLIAESDVQEESKVFEHKQRTHRRSKSA